MVQLTLHCFRRVYSKQFVDKLRIYVRGGCGGNGLPSLGGVGGNGGDVYIAASQNPQFSLKNFRQLHPTKRFKADPGENSHKRSLSGLKGASIFVQVPLGITLIDASTNTKVGEIMNPTDKVKVATGGKGGRRATRFLPSKGKKKLLWLDLKLIADVGFVGFPNAGKSSLLRCLTRAAPKVAEYPFTTIKPELGVISYPDYRQIQLADLPGLIEGAHMNLGRGHVFLKHVERTNLLLFAVDVTGFQLSHKAPFRDAFQTVQLLMKELELYDVRLTNKPAILAVNKMDLEGAEHHLEELRFKLANWKDFVGSLPEDSVPQRQMEFKDILPTSALNKIGISHLKMKIREEIDQMTHVDDEQLKLEMNKDDFIELEEGRTPPLLL